MNLNQLLQQFGENQVAGFLLVLGRIGPLFALAPLFSSKSIPMRAKGVCAVALSVGIAPIALAGHAVPLEVGQFVELMLKEILVGLAYAFALMALFAAVATAGSFLDTLIGFSYGALVDPVTGNQSAVLTQAYVLVGIMVLIAIGGDQLMIRGLARSYDLVPLLQTPSLPALVGGAQSAFTQVFLSAMELAAPVVLAIVITDAAFGVVSRVVPQLNVFAVGFPAKVAVGLLIIGVSLPFAAGWMADELQRSVATALQSIRMA
ncbi:MAG TPA: flagellar biosynthetic protein FliR [Solirubrobacteraceae bacterium]|jgi:flagellar biosynthetic protein FliR|nr:flagellar biosynthetic protein FliR [Solirubrobacteraceae bacterium]